MIRLSAIVSLFKFGRVFFSHIALIIGVIEYWPNIQNALTFSVGLLSFIFFYGAIYAMNDIADYELDKVTPKNKDRALVSGKLSRTQAWYIVLITWGWTLAVMWSFSSQLFSIAVVLLFINVLYSWLLKKIAYVDIIVIATSQPLKFYVALALCGIQFPPLFSTIFPFLVMYFILVLMHTEKQIVNITESDKRNFIIGKYSKEGLLRLGYVSIFLCSISLYLSINSREFIWCLVGVAVALVFRFGIRATKSIEIVRYIEGIFQPK